KNTMKTLVVIILIYGIRGEQSLREPLSRLNEVITIRIKEILKEHSLGQFSTHYITIQRAAELPISFLDKKIEAYNTFKFMQQADGSLFSINGTKTHSMTYSERASSSHQELTRFEIKIVKLIKKLGICDNFTARVFKAIFSDEKQLKKLKSKLEELEKKDMNLNNDSLWNFIIDMF
ncbi:hypothetical protein KR032_007805, partial [Drosophila birchii]